MPRIGKVTQQGRRAQQADWKQGQRVGNLAYKAGRKEENGG
jgi:hypothetical protein